MRVLIVEDELRLADALAEIMKKEKYLVDVVHDGEDGYIYARDEAYDVVVLDIMLPKLDGFEVVKRLRADGNATPVLMLTARDEVSDRVRGLDSGADDYLTKPFSPEELLARIRALTRRQGEVVLNEVAAFDLVLNLSANTLAAGEKTVRLGFKEFEVMRILMQNRTVITSKEELIQKVWGVESDAEDNNVEAYISFLRKKLNYLESRAGIDTIRKVGYRLEEKEA